MTFGEEHMPPIEVTMILEQRFGAAQVAVRATDALLALANAPGSTTIGALRRDIYVTAWYQISQKHAVGSLVNLLNTLLIALEPIQSVRVAQRVLVDVVTTFRQQLIQRVPDTANHSMSVLSQCKTVMLYGYSTTVLYALQHALRNGQRIEVVCVAATDHRAHSALVERIAAIGLTVNAIEYPAAAATISGVDAVVVGADTLDVYGLTNTAGTAALASLAHVHLVPFYSFCTSEKFLPSAFFQGGWTSLPFDGPNTPVESHYPTAYDVTPIERVSGVITERGSLPAPAIEAWLAAERIHPWLRGRGALLDMPHSCGLLMDKLSDEPGDA
jgi:translation initiation factor 2B subunit (eIF-2B alpha/beta/delta family)